jgi:hypothetical protein
VSRYLDRYRRPLRTIFTIVVAFALARIAFGVFAILFMGDDALATSLTATLILALAALVGIAVALYVRRSPATTNLTTND